MKIMIDNDGDAVMLDATQIKAVQKVEIDETEISFEISYYTTENSVFVFEFATFENLSKDLVIANVEKIRKDIIVYLNGGAEPEFMGATINLSKKDIE